MYDRILAAVNEHLNSEVSARYALHLAKAANAQIHFCSIADRGIGDRNFQLAEEAVKRLSNTARELGVKAECILATGDPLEQIRKTVVTEDVDLVFAATRQEDVEQRFYARSLARRLLLALPCSVALVRVVHMGRVHPREILVPVKDRIDHIPERSYFTAMLAKAFGSRVNLFQTAAPLRKILSSDTSFVPASDRSGISHDLSRFIGHLDRYRIEHEKSLASGVDGKTITIEAAAKRRDLIIMGASLRGFFSRTLRSSTVEYVLRETPCNMIILKPEQ